MLMLFFRPGRRIQHHDRPLLRVLGNNARYARIVKLNCELSSAVIPPVAYAPSTGSLCTFNQVMWNRRAVLEAH